MALRRGNALSVESRDNHKKITDKDYDLHLRQRPSELLPQTLLIVRCPEKTGNTNYDLILLLNKVINKPSPIALT